MQQFLITKGDNEMYDIYPIINYFSSAKPGRYMVEVRLLRKTRSLDQNAWLWGCIYPLLLNALNNEGWEFTDIEEVHEFFKTMFRQHKFVNKHTGEIVSIPESTTKMDTVIFSEYCEQLRNYGREYLGIDIPDPVK